MRASLLVVALCAGHGAAAADAKTRELARGYDKELAACRTRADGVTRVTTGTQALVDAGQTQYEADLAALRAGLAEVQRYCAELTATLEILNADPDAKYRALEKKLDDQDNKIRKLRQTTKKVLDDLAPVISRMITPINARAGTAAPPPKKVRLKFPSGRAVDGPALPGTYRTSGADAIDIVEYSDAKLTATLTAKLFASTTCAQQRQAIAAADAGDVALTDATRPLDLAWYVGYARPGRRVRVACRAAGAAALVATADEPSGVAGWPDLEPLLAAMIAARP